MSGKSSLDRHRAHLVDMCDGKPHTFFEHEMAAEMASKGWITPARGSWVITQAGRAQAEIALLRGLLADLTYNGTDRGYVRGSRMWDDQVRISARACGLSEAEADILVEAECAE